MVTSFKKVRKLFFVLAVGIVLSCGNLSGAAKVVDLYAAEQRALLGRMAKNGVFVQFVKDLGRNFETLSDDEKYEYYSLYSLAIDREEREESRKTIQVLGHPARGWERILPNGSYMRQPYTLVQESPASCGYHAIYNAKILYALLREEEGVTIDAMLETDTARAITRSLFDEAIPMGEWRKFVVRNDPQGAARKGEFFESQQLEGLIEQFFPEVGDAFSTIDTHGRLVTAKDLEYNYDLKPYFWAEVRRTVVEQGAYVFFINTGAENFEAVAAAGRLNKTVHSGSHWISLMVVNNKATKQFDYYVCNSADVNVLDAPYVMNCVTALEALPMPKAPQGPVVHQKPDVVLSASSDHGGHGAAADHGRGAAAAVRGRCVQRGRRGAAAVGRGRGAQRGGRRQAAQVHPAQDLDLDMAIALSLQEEDYE